VCVCVCVCVCVIVEYLFFLPVALQPKPGLGCLVLRLLDLMHLDTRARARAVGILWTSDQLVPGAATYITHKKHKRRTSIP